MFSLVPIQCQWSSQTPEVSPMPPYSRTLCNACQAVSEGCIPLSGHLTGRKHFLELGEEVFATL